jgi:hypothetical protein
MWIWEHAERLGSLAQLALTFIAVIALVFAYLQIRSSQQSQQQATAKEIYRDYLRLSFDNPSLASPKDDDQEIISDYRYRWFVAVMLNACEEILATFGNDDTWNNVVLAEMEYHKTYLHSQFFLSTREDRGWELYSSELRALFESRFPSKVTQKQSLSDGSSENSPVGPPRCQST